MKFLIVDGYPLESRRELEDAGVGAACGMFERMLRDHLPQAQAVPAFPADTEEIPDLAGYRGILWTGCNLCLHSPADPRVDRQVEIARRAFAAGIPQFGSCWAVQIAAVAAGGRVAANPRGREMFLARKIALTDEGRRHPMYEGKRPVFDGFISHLDEVAEVPANSIVLAGNEFTGIQALEVRHGRGVFWGLQYHPEYDLHSMGRLMAARKAALLREGLYRSEDEADAHLRDIAALAAEPDRKDLRWRLSVDEDVLDRGHRQVEFANWLRVHVLAEAVGAV